MTANVVSLTVHRNTSRAGFVLVAWNGNGETTVACDLSADVFPSQTAPEFVYSEIKDALK